jgi:TIGR03009 family protein
MRLNVQRVVVVLAFAAVGNCAASLRAQTGSGSPNRSPARGASPDTPSVAVSPRQQGAARGASDPATGGNMPAARRASPAGQAGAPPAGPRDPFKLTPSQQQLVDQILLKWEKQSDKVKTFKCEFHRWEYDPTWGPEKHDCCTTDAKGEIKYAAPDRGEYMVDELRQYDSNKKDYVVKKEGLDQWICTGKAIFEFNSLRKELIERRLPPDLQGKAISDGPLPFLFGAKADQLKRRYWMRDVTPRDEIGKSIRLEAAPKFQQDAANFQRATIILNESDFMPVALQIILPGADERPQQKHPAGTDYAFHKIKVNDIVGTWDFTAPRLSPALALRGWKHVVESDSAEEQKDASPPPEDPKQAKRTAPAPRRK